MICPICGNQTDDNAEYCPYCGSWFTQPAQQENSQPDYNDPNGGMNYGQENGYGDPNAYSDPNGGAYYDQANAAGYSDPNGGAYYDQGNAAGYGDPNGGAYYGQGNGAGYGDPNGGTNYGQGNGAGYGDPNGGAYYDQGNANGYSDPNGGMNYGQENGYGNPNAYSDPNGGTGYGQVNTSAGPNDPNAKKKKSGGGKAPVKAIAIVAAVVVVLVIAVKLISGLFSASGYTVTYFYDSGEGTTTFYVGTKDIGTVDGSVDSTFSNIDRTAHYVLMLESDDSYTAYYVSETGVNKIIDDCEDISVAANGKAALVLDDEGTLSLYKCSGKKLSEVADNENIVSCVISGDGSTYAYTEVKYDEDSYEYTFNSYIGKNETKAKNVIVVAMSETGKYIYGGTYDDDYDTELVLISSSGETTKISSDVDNLIALNEDGSQIMFMSDSKIYISEKGGKKEKVESGSSVNVFYDSVNGAVCGYVYPVSSFKNAIISVYSSGEYTVYSLNSSFEAKEIADDIYTYQYGTNLKYMYYLDDDDTLYRIELKAGKKASEIGDDVYSLITVSEDATVCYYLDYDDTVHYVKGTSDKTVNVLSDVTYASGVIRDGILYVQVSQDGEYGLYYVKGTSASRISNDDDISVRMSKSCDTIYAFEYGEEILYEISGKSMKELSTDYESISGGGFF